MTRRIFFFILASGLISGCTGPKPLLLQGDANSAEVSSSGNLDDATLVAKKHCAQYERVPRFSEAAGNIAYFDCVRP